MTWGHLDDMGGARMMWGHLDDMGDTWMTHVSPVILRSLSSRHSETPLSSFWGEAEESVFSSLCGAAAVKW